MIARIFRQQDAQTPADEANAQQAEQPSQVVPAEPVGTALTPATRMKEYLDNVKKQKAIMKHNVLDEATRVQDEWYNKGLDEAQAKPVATPARATKAVPVSIAQPEEQHQTMEVESVQTLADESVDQSQTLVVQSQAFEQTQEAVSNHESAGHTQEQSMETESSAPDSAVAQTPSEQNLQLQQPQQDAKYACCTIEDWGIPVWAGSNFNNFR